MSSKVPPLPWRIFLHLEGSHAGAENRNSRMSDIFKNSATINRTPTATKMYVNN